MTHVSYTGAQVRAGEVVPIVVLFKHRMLQHPEVPTAAESAMPGLVFSIWFAIVAPRYTDPLLVR